MCHGMDALVVWQSPSSMVTTALAMPHGQGKRCVCLVLCTYCEWCGKAAT
jgi:hypothetical protein